MKKIYTKEEIQALAKSAIGKTFKELKRRTESSNEKTSNKGRFGQLLETDLYGYEINSNAEADFKEAGIELKVTPYIRNKNDPTVARKAAGSQQNFKEENEMTNNKEKYAFWLTPDAKKMIEINAFLHKGRLLLCEEKDRLTEAYGILRGGAEDIDPAATEPVRPAPAPAPVTPVMAVHDVVCQPDKPFTAPAPPAPAAPPDRWSCRP